MTALCSDWPIRFSVAVIDQSVDIRSIVRHSVEDRSTVPVTLLK